MEAYRALTEQYRGMLFNKIWFLSGNASEIKRIIESGLIKACAQIQMQHEQKFFSGRSSRAFLEAALEHLNKRTKPEPSEVPLDKELVAEVRPEK